MTALKRFKAMLVDDDEVTNYLNEAILVASAHFKSPLLFSDSLFALDFIQKIRSGLNDQPLPNLFLVDINMPNLDGFEFVEQLQEIHPKIMDEAVVCFLTTSNHSKDYRRAKALGIDFYIEKPLKMKDIKRLITQLNKRLKSLLS